MKPGFAFGARRWDRLPSLSTTVIERAAHAFGQHPADIVGPLRKRQLVEARWAVMLALRNSGFSFPQIGRPLGDRDHTTIMHGVARAEALLVSDSEFAERFDRVAA